MGWSEYWSDSWNKFDFIVVTGSVFDLVLSLFNTSVLRAVRITRAFSRLFRLARVTRVLRLAKSIEGLRKLIMTLWAALPALFNVGSLLLLLFFIYAVLGVFLFGEVELQVRLALGCCVGLWRGWLVRIVPLVRMCACVLSPLTNFGVRALSQSSLNVHANFSRFGIALLTLFRIATGASVCGAQPMPHRACPSLALPSLRQARAGKPSCSTA